MKVRKRRLKGEVPEQNHRALKVAMGKGMCQTMALELVLSSVRPSLVKWWHTDGATQDFTANQP